MRLFHRGPGPKDGTLARIASAAATAATTAAMLSISIGIQGCIENPGADHRLHQRSREYHVIATAEYARESVLELSLKQDSGAINLRILSLARVPIDSAEFLLQFGETENVANPNLYHRTSKLNVIVRIANLQPRAVLEYGAISREMDLGYTYPSAKLIRFAYGDARGNPLGGVYGGTYSIVDTAGRRTTAPIKGIITADGEYQFVMETLFGGEGLRGYLFGRLDSARTENYFSSEFFGGQPYPILVSAPIALNAGALTGAFLFPKTIPWLDSMGFEMHPTRFIGE